jgi:predicted nucleic acid-binding protein
LDASVFIAAEAGRTLSRHPAGQARVSERRAKAFDCFVAATALAHGLVVVAQDTDFETLQAVEPRLAVELV